MGKTTIKCVACGEDIIMSEDDRVLVISPRNEWEGYFHFPKCMVAISKAAAKQSVQPTVLCTCFTNNLGTIERVASNCPVHNTHSG